jgi:hypothetical protein
MVCGQLLLEIDSITAFAVLLCPVSLMNPSRFFKRCRLVKKDILEYYRISVINWAN